MKLKAGKVYMLSIKADYLGVYAKRILWKPWRYKVYAIQWDFRNKERVLLAWDQSSDGALGIIKLFEPLILKREQSMSYGYHNVQWYHDTKWDIAWGMGMVGDKWGVFKQESYSKPELVMLVDSNEAALGYIKLLKE